MPCIMSGVWPGLRLSWHRSSGHREGHWKVLTGDGASSKPRPAVGVPPPPVSPAGSLAPHTARPGQRCCVGCSRVGTAVAGQPWGQQGKDATPGLGHLEPSVKGVTFPVLMFLFANLTCEGGGPEEGQRRSVHTETISKLQNLSRNITNAPWAPFPQLLPLDLSASLSPYILCIGHCPRTSPCAEAGSRCV